jgi:uncharacterized protein (TIGR00304 family)
LAIFIKTAVSFYYSPGGYLVNLDLSVFFMLAIALIIIGILIIIAALVLAMARGGEDKRRVKGAGVIMIGPIPIIFGTDKKSVKTVLVLALALTIMIVVAMMIYYLLMR